MAIENQLENWVPKTKLGKLVKAKEITSFEDLLDKGQKILEPEIVDFLVPNLTLELLEVGQAKGKFGGGKATIWKQTQKVTKEAPRMKFSTCAVVGNKNGLIGIGYGSAKETVPAREKAIRQAKLNMIKVIRGCGSWDCRCGEPHSIPYKTTGKMGGAHIKFLPAPKGTGLSCQKQCKQMLELAGIKDVYSQSLGPTKTRLNLAVACYLALKNMFKIKTNEQFEKVSGLVAGVGGK